VYKQAAALFVNDAKWADACDLLESWAKADPADAQPHGQLGRLQLIQKQYKDAEKSFQDAIALSTEPDRLKLQLGQAQVDAGDTDAGKATLHALMDTSDDAGILNDTAYALGDAGLDLPAAEAASAKAVRMQETRAATATLASAKNEDFGNVSELAANWDTGLDLFQAEQAAAG
jgi:hypothetical protein